MAPSALGEFLRARRSRVGPEDVGLPAVSQRRVSGLRREEVALLAGMSVDYYVRLEQGRERSPSVQVLEALSSTLRLDEDARAHLFRLAGLGPRPRPIPAPEAVAPELLRLLESWPEQPALVLGGTYDVLARNRIGRALFEEFDHSDNLLLNIFLDPVAHRFYRDWQSAAVNTVAGFRLLTAQRLADPRVAQILLELEEHSPEFRRIWARNDARGKNAESKTFVHHQVGELTLHMQAFDVRSAPGQQLIVYHTEPDSPSAQAVRLLGSLAATADLES